MAIPTFPTLPGIAFPVKRTPRWSSLRHMAVSGRETFQPLWQSPIRDYEVSFALLRADQAHQEYQALVGFWNAVMATPGGVFRWTDPEDSAVANQPMGAGDGSTASFQLVRTQGGFTEPVLDPVCAPNVPDLVIDDGNCTTAPTQFLDDGDCTAPAQWADHGFCADVQVFFGAYATGPTTPLAAWSFAGGSAAASGGIVTIAPAPADGTALHWTGAYNWLCRFRDDALGFAEFMYLLYELKTCAFSTIRL
jgi:hypothetical protein